MHTPKILSVLLTLALLVTSSGVSAAQGNRPVETTLYVDGSIGVNQCDTYNPATRSCGSGSDTAYLTIVDAAAVVQPGDTVLIQPGTYDGGITVETGGTAGEPITFRANGAGVVIEGSGGDRDAFFITVGRLYRGGGIDDPACQPRRDAHRQRAPCDRAQLHLCG